MFICLLPSGDYRRSSAPLTCQTVPDHVEVGLTGQEDENVNLGFVLLDIVRVAALSADLPARAAAPG